MSQWNDKLPAVTLDDARAAKKRVVDLLIPVIPDAGIGISKGAGGYFIKVNLTQSPPEGFVPPADVDHVPVVFEVVGAVRAR